MTCKPNTQTFGPTPSWTKGHTSNWLFHPMSPPQSTVGIRKVRAAVEVGQDSGDCKSRPAYRTTNDGVTWDSPVALGTTTQTGDGVTYDDEYVDISADTDAKQLVQFGNQLVHATTSDIHHCMVTLKLDIE